VLTAFLTADAVSLSAITSAIGVMNALDSS
jgi:hypothetical protein